VDCILVKFDINKLDKHVLNRLVSKRTAIKGFVNTFDDKFHCFVQVLNTLGHVKEEIGSIDILDVFCLFLVKTGLDHHITAFKRLLVHGYLMVLDHLNNMLRERMKCKVEPVVTVWRLTFDRFGKFLGDGFTVHHNRFGSDDLNTLITLDTSGDDLKVQFPHT